MLKRTILRYRELYIYREGMSGDHPERGVAWYRNTDTLLAVVDLTRISHRVHLGTIRRGFHNIKELIKQSMTARICNRAYPRVPADFSLLPERLVV